MRPVATVVAPTAAKNALTKRKGTVVTRGVPPRYGLIERWHVACFFARHVPPRTIREVGT
jgi:hypothetical protein